MAVFITTLCWCRISPRVPQNSVCLFFIVIAIAPMQPWIMKRVYFTTWILKWKDNSKLYLFQSSVCVFLHRLKLSPSPPSRVTRSVVASSSSSRSSRAKRKRVEAEDETGSAPSFRVSQQAEATGSISIEELDLEGKSVTLKNNSNKVPYFSHFPFRKADLGFRKLLYNVYRSKAKCVCICV